MADRISTDIPGDNPPSFTVGDLLKLLRRNEDGQEVLRAADEQVPRGEFPGRYTILAHPAEALLFVPKESLMPGYPEIRRLAEDSGERLTFAYVCEFRNVVARRLNRSSIEVGTLELVEAIRVYNSPVVPIQQTPQSGDRNPTKKKKKGKPGSKPVPERWEREYQLWEEFKKEMSSCKPRKRPLMKLFAKRVQIYGIRNFDQKAFKQFLDNRRK